MHVVTNLTVFVDLLVAATRHNRVANTLGQWLHNDILRGKVCLQLLIVAAVLSDFGKIFGSRILSHSLSLVGVSSNHAHGRNVVGTDNVLRRLSWRILLKMLM